VTVEPMGTGLGERLRTHNFQAVLAELLQSGDPDPYPMWDQTQIESGQNYGGWDNRAASEALEQARRVIDRDQRRAFYSQFQRIFAQEVPALIISYPVYTYALDQSIHLAQIGPLSTPSDRFRNVAEWYLRTQRVTVIEDQLASPTP
jgi:peptide/nickel transport system substrate-binding protein